MDTLKIFRKGWNYSQDGPGNRLVYHLQGCNLRCPWCSNPEGLAKEGALLVYPEKLLDRVCPHGAINGQKVNRKLCDSCQTRECLTLNRNLGIQSSCREYSVEDLVAEATQSRPLFYDGGGVTLTGGEATLQFETVHSLCCALKAGRVNTALETNGTHPRLLELFAVIDTLIMDLKHYNSRIHRETTGVGNEMIVENIKRAARAGQNLLIRIPLIPDFNDSEDDAREFARFLRQLPDDRLTVEILPYHEYGKVKWEQCGMEYAFQTAGLAAGKLETTVAILQKHGLKLVWT
jgi:pyruvate formate lyase activating enzyme